LVSSSVIGIMAQRLVRRICPNCSQEYQPSLRELREIGLGNDDNDMHHKFRYGEGCEKCFQTGYRSRTGVYELMLISEDIKDLIYRRETAGKIKKVALNDGLQTLRMDGGRKVLAGTTTIAEVLRVTQTDVI